MKLLNKFELAVDIFRFNNQNHSLLIDNDNDNSTLLCWGTGSCWHMVDIQLFVD